MKHRYAYLGVALVLTLSLFAQGLGGASAKTASAPTLKGPIKIGQITSLTGPYAVYGVMQQAGFKAGLAYATNGTNKVLGAKIQVKTVSDVSSTTTLPDPTVATADAKTLIEQDHVNFIQCCASSATAYAVAGLMPTYKKIDMVAPAADDSLTGVNRYTFRTSREDSQDAKTGASYAVKTFGKSYMMIAQNYSFGQNQEKVWGQALNKLGATNAGDPILFPLTATDFTPYIQQVQNKKPKWLFVACAGTQCTGLFNQLVSSGLTNQVKIMTGLPNVAAISSFGSAGPKMGFISVYYYTFPKTKANNYLKSYIQKHYKRPADIFDQDSFAAAQQLVAAVKKAKSLNTQKLIKALEGQSVNGPKGIYTIRKADHLCLQPMYVAKLVNKNGTLTPKLLKTLTPKQAAPGVQAHNW